VLLGLPLATPQVYIGDLGEDATRHEIEDCFAKFGPVRNIWVAKRPPGGCSLQFEGLDIQNQIHI